jgi:hypothetical protein
VAVNANAQNAMMRAIHHMAYRRYRIGLQFDMIGPCEKLISIN